MGQREAASHDAQTTDMDRLENVQGDAENLSFLDDGSVDLLISDSYAHEAVRICQSNASTCLALSSSSLPLDRLGKNVARDR